MPSSAIAVDRELHPMGGPDTGFTVGYSPSPRPDRGSSAEGNTSDEFIERTTFGGAASTPRKQEQTPVNIDWSLREIRCSVLGMQNLQDPPLKFSLEKMRSAEDVRQAIEREVVRLLPEADKYVVTGLKFGNDQTDLDDLEDEDLRDLSGRHNVLVALVGRC